MPGRFLDPEAAWIGRLMGKSWEESMGWKEKQIQEGSERRNENGVGTHFTRRNTTPRPSDPVVEAHLYCSRSPITGGIHMCEWVCSA